MASFYDIKTLLLDFYIPAIKTNARHGAIDSRRERKARNKKRNMTTFQANKRASLEALDFHKLKSRVVFFIGFSSATFVCNNRRRHSGNNRITNKRVHSYSRDQKRRGNCILKQPPFSRRCRRPLIFHSYHKNPPLICLFSNSKKKFNLLFLCQLRSSM